MHRRTLIAVVIVGALVMSLWPVAAHANVFTDVADSVLSSLLSLVIDLLNLIRGLLIELISVLGTLLNTVIGQPELSYGGAAVYTIWKIFRDICNLLFIVLFIFVAFGTIFNSLGWLKGWHYSSALKNIIIAAIAINFSLAIGQTIVWGGNFATGLASTMVTGKNVGAQIATALAISKVELGQQGIPVNAIPDTINPINQQNALQAIATRGFTGNAKITYDNCLKFNQQPTVNDCSLLAARVQAQQNAAAIDNSISQLNQSPSLKERLNDMWSFWSNVAQGAKTGATTGPLSYIPGGQVIGAAQGAWAGASFAPAAPKEAAKLSSGEGAQKILSLLLNVFLLLILTVSFGTVIVFMVFRFPMVWLLLSFSSLAFFTLAIPGSNKFKMWFSNLFGWCIFSPLYLLVIYLGIFLLGQQNTLLAGMKNSIFWGSIGVVMFYVMTAIIFVYGAKITFDYAFSLSKQSGLGWLYGKIGGAVGISEKTNFGISSLSRTLGITPNVQALGGRIQQQYQDVQAGLRGRAPALFGSADEATAAARRRFGVRGGEAKVAELQAGRVKTEQKIIEDTQKLQLRNLESARAVAASDVERKNLDGQITKLKELQLADLRRKSFSGNRDTQLAAGELLMNTGKMSTVELQLLGSQYQALSPAALTEFVKRRDEQLMKDAEKRKYKKGDEAKEIAEVLALFSDPKQAQKFIDAAGKGNNKFWALEAGTSRKIIMGPDGKTPVTLDYAVRERAGQFNATDVVHAESYYNRAGRDITKEEKDGGPPKEFKLQYEKSLLSPKRLAQMSITASSDLDQLARIHSRVDVLRNELPKLSIEVLDLTKKLKDTRDAANKLPDGKQKDDTLKEAEQLQGKLDIARDRLADLKSPIKDMRTKEEEKKAEKSGGGEAKPANKEEKKE